MSESPVTELPACWECNLDDDPWCFDCDQCNVDGMYDESGSLKEES